MTEPGDAIIGTGISGLNCREIHEAAANRTG
jgi:hypothetical protein